MKPLFTFLFALGLAIAPARIVLAQDAIGPDETLVDGSTGSGDTTTGDEALTEEEMSRFASRDLLTETFLSDEMAERPTLEADLSDAQMALDEAVASAASIPDLEQAVTDAQQAVDDAVAAGATSDEIATLEQAVTDAQMALDAAATPEEIAALEQAVTDAQMALDALDAEIASTEELIAQLSDQQVFDLNKALNNALASKLALNYDAEMLQAIVDGDYNGRQIMAYTQGLEREARFLDKADRFQAKYDESGNERFLDKVARFTNWAETQKNKFFAKVDRFADEPQTTGDPLADGTTLFDESGAGGAAKNAAKQAAKDAARDAAKQAAKNAAAKEARDVARAAAKDAVKQAGKSAENRGKGKKDS
jgi:hypothetical protein